MDSIDFQRIFLARFQQDIALGKMQAEREMKTVCKKTGPEIKTAKQEKENQDEPEFFFLFGYRIPHNHLRR